MAEAADIWADDLLGRAEDAKFIATFLRNRSQELAAQKRSKSYVLNLDAEWGQGKTFFLERLQKQLQGEGHLAVYVNAWRDDFADDPLVAAMAAIDAEVSRQLPPKSPARKAWEIAKASGGKVAVLAGKGLALRGAQMLFGAAMTSAMGVAISEGGELAKTHEEAIREGGKETVEATSDAMQKLADKKADAAVSDFAAARKSIDTFRKNLADFVTKLEKTKGVPPPFFVLIDELDRCRPPYAIAMLERIKHLFEIAGVVFVVATDSGQLVHSIGAVYGEKFDSEQYLKRFFDQTYTFEEPNVFELVGFLMQRDKLDGSKIRAPLDYEIPAFIIHFFQRSGASIRSIQQMYELLRTIVTAWSEAVPLQLAALLPAIWAFQRDRREFATDTTRAMFAPNWKGWAITVHERTGQRGETEVRGLQMKHVMENLWATAQGNMHSLMRDDEPSSEPARWVYRVLNQEFGARYNGKQVSRDEQYRSLIADYPQLVKQAGRISKV